ncbi:MAG: hypothetical protein E7328_04615 [Clostridiales bacterium]|nr:hypothetical protein [Clostridiales bacterium]
MICPNCSASIEDGLLVCPDCGHSLAFYNRPSEEYLSSTMEYTPSEGFSRRRDKAASESGRGKKNAHSHRRSAHEDAYEQSEALPRRRSRKVMEPAAPMDDFDLPEEAEAEPKKKRKSLFHKQDIQEPVVENDNLDDLFSEEEVAEEAPKKKRRGFFHKQKSAEEDPTSLEPDPFEEPAADEPVTEEPAEEPDYTAVPLFPDEAVAPMADDAAETETAASKEVLAKEESANADAESEAPTEPMAEATDEAADGMPAEDASSVAPAAAEEADEQTLSENKDGSHIDLSSTLRRPKDEAPKKPFLKVFLKWLCIFMAIGAACIGVHLLVTANFVTWQRFFNTIFGVQVEAPYVAPAVMEVKEEEGKYLRTFSVYGEDNYTLIVDSLGGKKVQFKDGVAQVTIEDSVWIADTPDPHLEYLEVHLDMRVMDELGYDSKVDVDPFLVYVPVTPVEFTFPTSQSCRVYEETATLEFTPPAGSTVLINGENVMNKMDESGVVRYSVPVEMGDNTVAFEATMPFARPLSISFNLRRTLHDVEIDLSQNIPSRTSEEKVIITGTLESGAALKTDASGSMKIDRGAGTFSFTANLKGYGIHEIVFHATKEGKEPTDVKVSIERIPDPRTFAFSAVSPAIDSFIANPGSYKSKGLYFNGMVQTTEFDNEFELEIGSSVIGFTYNGATHLKSGDEIRIYGSYDSVDANGKPYLNVWFVTK